ncbi:MAG TPA: cell division protein ZapA [Pyrinomonadaceae bacterium]|nr:cell division protein ZapA [Pyrinomonadaceae bacterium]
MSSAKTEEPAAESVRVNIFGQTYSLRSPQGGERVRRVAELVDERMREIASQLAVHDAAKVAVLAALNIAGELELVREYYEREIESLLTREPDPEPEGESPATAVAEAGGTARDDVPQVSEGGIAEETAPHVTSPAEVAEKSAETTAETAAETTAQTTASGEAGAGRERADRRSWFDEIFDTEFSSGGGPGRLSSQVSTRLQRLRQATREGSISDGEAGDD